MADQFVGEIRIVPFNFAPFGWALCDGQLLAISQNTALFSLLGTYYGGDGKSNFALPNLQGSAPMNQGNGLGLTPRVLGEVGGETAVTLLVSQMPAHTHAAKNAAVSNAGTPGPTVTFGGGGRGKAPAYAPASAQNAAQLMQRAVGLTGGNQPHNNMPPYLTLNFVIALQGIFPPRS
jgi:microcystin-dependent protein